MSVLPAQPSNLAAAPSGRSIVRRAVTGSVWLLLAQSLMLPAGLGVLVYLSRALGPTIYGQYATVMVLLVWIEFGLSAILGRSSVKLVSQSDDPRGTAAALLRLAALFGVAGTLVLWALAWPIALLLQDPALAAPLRLAAIDLPLFVVAAIYQSSVTAMGRFGRRAVITAVRWPMRLVLAILLVELGLGITGALWAVIGASTLELLACFGVNPLRLWRVQRIAGKLHLAETLPLFASSLALRAMDGADLLMLRGFGADQADAGAYAVAMNLAVIPGLVSMAVFPTLMVALIQMTRAGRGSEARQLCATVMRAGVWLIPLIAAATVGGPALIILCFTETYADAGPLLTVLLWGGLARLMIAVGGAMLAGIGRSSWAWWAVAPSMPVAVIGYLTLIPRFGSIGAAWSTTSAGLIGVVVTLGFLHRQLQLSPPWRSLAWMMPVALLGVGLTWLTRGSGVGSMLMLGVVTLMTTAAACMRGDWPLPRREETRHDP